jgi:hypothetical protein
MHLHNFTTLDLRLAVETVVGFVHSRHVDQLGHVEIEKLVLVVVAKIRFENPFWASRGAIFGILGQPAALFLAEPERFLGGLLCLGWIFCHFSLAYPEDWQDLSGTFSTR